MKRGSITKIITPLIIIQGKQNFSKTLIKEMKAEEETKIDAMIIEGTGADPEVMIEIEKIILEMIMTQSTTKDKTKIKLKIKGGRVIPKDKKSKIKTLNKNINLLQDQLPNHQLLLAHLKALTPQHNQVI